MNRMMRGLATAGLLCLGSALVPSANAAEIAVIGPVVEGVAGSDVTASISFAIGVEASYRFTGFDFLLTYDPTKLMLRPEASTIRIGDAPAIGYGEFLVTLSGLTGFAPEFLAGHDPDAGEFWMRPSLSFDIPFLPLDGPVVVNAAFRIADGLPVGTSAGYSVSGAVFSPAALDPSQPEFIVGDTFQFTSAVVVSAVPEPETWAMLLGGLVLMVGVARRRVRTR